MSSTFRFGAVFRHLYSRLRQRSAVAEVHRDPKQKTRTDIEAADAAFANGHLDAAQRGYESILQDNPRDLYVIYQLATVLQARGQLAAAVAICDRGLMVQPDQPGMLNRRASIAAEMGDHRNALAIYQRIVEVAPDYAGIDAKLADQYSHLGQGSEALAAFERAIALDPDSARLQSDRLFVMNYFKLMDRQALFEEHRRWGAAQEGRLASVRRPWMNSKVIDRKLRIGYVSGDLRHHAVAFFIEGVLRHHDRQQVEVHCFDASPYAEDTVTQRMKLSADRWHRIANLSDAEVDDLIRSMKIDILVDLSGHSAHNRLLVFARKPAPVQISWFAYMNTTGLSAIDYRITDAYMDPPGESDRYYTEHLVRIKSMACFTPYPESPPVSPLPALSSGVFTFVSVNQWTKVSDEVKELWGSILSKTPAARLVVIVRGGDLADVKRGVIAEFVKYGAKASQIVVYATRPIREFLELFSQVDVALDPFPYGGGTSSMHTIWMGVPIVTLEGKSEMSRAASGIVRAVGLDDWVAPDLDGYRQIALRAAADPASLVPIRAKLRDRMRASPLTDAASLTKDVERAYREMWHAYSSK
jgi:predicted O-linked N-acetylglucosamine transferase (SPINDLY family)